MFVEEFENHLLDLGIPETMPAAFNGMEGHIETGLLHSIVEKHALVERYQIIFITVTNQKWRIIFADVGDGIGSLTGLVIVLNRSADQFRLG